MRGQATPTLDADRAAFLTQGALESLSVAPQEAAALATGSIINGRYTVRRSIARGGMGWVYEVADALAPERAVALKIVPAIGSNPVKLSWFKAEFATMTKLDHPNVARVHDFEQIQGSDDFVITMERIDGAPLTHGGGWKSAVERIVQVCRALAYVHSRHIVHFDLKPANILVDTSGRVKVVDFGISGAEPLARDGRIVGTPQYMPPELLLGGGHVDHRADLYSLGITLYELLAGEVEVPAWLARLVERLCARDPADRPRHANAVIQEINAGGGFEFPIETAETRESYVMTPRFAGRAAEVERVVGFVSRRLSGEGGAQALLVSGLSGIGKSRLMREVRQAAQLRRLVFLEANCYERSFVEYGPIADLLHQLVPLVEALGGSDVVHAALPELVKLAPKLGQGRSHRESPKAATAEGERARLYEAATTFFIQAAKRVPIALYLNDLQWAARGTAQLFHLIAQRLRDEEARGAVKLALLGSYRSDEVEGRPLAETVRVVSNERLGETIELASLEAPEVEEVITSMLGVESVPADFLARVARETAGNPFFVQEVMRVLFDNGTVFLDEQGRWATKEEVGALDIPGSMTEVFRRRFALLGSEEKDVVRVLAVHGQPMRVELLGEVLGDVTTVMKALVTLEGRAIAEKQPGKALAYNIAHDRMRETIYAGITDAERRPLHRDIAEKLEAATAAMEEKQKPLDELARHFREAEHEDKALDYARRAGKRAIASYANEAAVEHLRYVKELNQRRQTREAELLELLAEALIRKGDTPTAAGVLGEALAACQTPLARSRVRGKLSRCRWAQGAFAECVEEAWRALEELGVRKPRTRIGLVLAVIREVTWVVRTETLSVEGRAIDETARVMCLHYSWLGAGLLYVDAPPLLVAHVGIRAAIHGQKAGSCEEGAMARGTAAVALAWMGYHQKGERWLEAMREEAMVHHYLEVQAGIGLGLFGIVAGHRACSPEQLPALHTAIQAAKLAGTPLLGVCLNNLVFAGCLIGAWKETLDAYRSVTLYIERFAPSFADDNGVFGVAPLALLHGSGHADEALAIANATLERARKQNQRLVAQVVNDSSAEAVAATGDRQGAIHRLEQSLSSALESRACIATREVFRLLPRLYLQPDPLDEAAQRRAARVIEQGRRIIKKGHEDKRPLVELSEAILLEARGKRQDADSKFGQALQTARGQGARFYVYDILLQRGLILEKRGERANARRDIDEARAHAFSCADRYVTNLCDDALARLQRL